VFDLFDECCRAIAEQKLIERPSRTDKEFHFQNWVEARLEALGVAPQQRGRNSYPDFVLPNGEGYEVKGLEFPGRYTNFDSNSQIPAGSHGGWEPIFYVFGRYPKGAGETYGVTDLVICHGDFLNAMHDYVHRNRNVKGFGTYGDIMIRDRKMYVVPTPYALAEGVEGRHTVIAPAEMRPPEHLVQVGDLKRMESERMLVSYAFDLRTNEIDAAYVDNPSAGHINTFTAYRQRGRGDTVAVTMRDTRRVVHEEQSIAEQDEDGDD
jgi:hypothetical protein